MPFEASLGRPTGDCQAGPVIRLPGSGQPTGSSKSWGVRPMDRGEALLASQSPGWGRKRIVHLDEGRGKAFGLLINGPDKGTVSHSFQFFSAFRLGKPRAFYLHLQLPKLARSGKDAGMLRGPSTGGSVGAPLLPEESVLGRLFRQRSSPSFPGASCFRCLNGIENAGPCQGRRGSRSRH